MAGTTQGYTLDASASRVTLRTGTVGMFASLAHDLELLAPVVRGEAAVEAGAWTGRVVVAARALRVVGVVRAGRVDEAALAPHDRAEIERRIRDEVFRGLPEVVVEARGQGAQGTATVHGARGGVAVPLVGGALQRDARGGVALEGECALSLRALGLPETRGPLGAFRVADAVQARFRVAFAPAEPTA